MRHFVFISSNYPTKSHPQRGTFVRSLVRAIAAKGVKCSVIAPLNIFKEKQLDEKQKIDSVIKNNTISVYHPRYLSISSKICGINTIRFTISNFRRAVMSVLTTKLESKPDIIYGHFCYPSGVVAVEASQTLNIPSFVAVGESQFKIVEDVGFEKATKDFNSVNGIISVSERNSKFCHEVLNIPQEKIRLFPNGVDFDKFKPHDKTSMRMKYNLPLDKTIIAFTGHFISRKGPNKVLEAIKGFRDIGVVFMGEGPIKLEGDNILYKGVVDHSQIPELLSAADMFVLPTTAEGSSNAIIEAMACGLPVVSSHKEFNEGIINDAVSIRIDPMNIDDIRKAILELHNNVDKRELMSQEAYRHSRKFGIHTRSDGILKFINTILVKREPK